MKELSISQSHLLIDTQWNRCMFRVEDFHEWYLMVGDVSEVHFKLNSKGNNFNKIFPGGMYNYILCPYYLLSFLKLYSVVCQKLHWYAASIFYFR